jgi:hypothetical protein
MIRKSGKRFSEKIMLKKEDGDEQTPAQFAKKKAARRRPSMSILPAGARPGNPP